MSCSWYLDDSTSFCCWRSLIGSNGMVSMSESAWLGDLDMRALDCIWKTDKSPGSFCFIADSSSTRIWLSGMTNILLMKAWAILK